MSLFQRVGAWWTRATKPVVVKIDAGPTIHDLPLYSQYQRVGGPITPEQVTDAVRHADVGTMWPLVTLVNDARRKDGHLQAILGTREMALPSLPWEAFSFPGARRKDRKAAEWLTEALTQAAGGPQEGTTLHGLRGLLAHLQSGVLHGYALAETVCEKSGGLLWPVGWNTIGAHRVLFESRTGRPHWFDPTGKTQYPGIDLRAGFAPGKILFYQPRVTGDEPTREGLARVLLWASLFRNWSLRDWVALGELAWKPWRQGVYKKGADKKDISELRDVLRQMSASGVALVPDTTELKVEWPAGNKQDGTHQGLMAFLAGEMSKAVLGQTLTTEAGERGARALGQVHDQIRHDILEFDAVSVAEVVRRDLIAPLIRRNFGPDVAVPGFRFLTEEAVDLLNFSQGVRNLTQSGLRVPAAWVRDRVGAPEPKDGEECLGPPDPSAGEVDIPIDPATGLPALPAKEPTP